MKFATPVVRTPVYMDPAHLHQCKQLSAKYGVNRSEVIRLALAHGLPQVVPDLRRIVRQREVVERRLDATEPSSSASVASSVDASDQLAEYGRTLRQLEPNRSVAEVRSLLTVQAEVLGVSPAELDDVVDEVVSSMPPPDVSPEAGGHVVDRSQPPD